MFNPYVFYSVMLSLVELYEHHELNHYFIPNKRISDVNCLESIILIIVAKYYTSLEDATEFSNM